MVFAPTALGMGGDGADEIFDGERFGKVIRRKFPLFSFNLLDKALGVAAHINNPHRRLDHSDALDEFQTAFAGHLDVRDDEIRFEMPVSAQGVLTVGGRFHPIAFPGQHSFHQREHDAVVVDDQYFHLYPRIGSSASVNEPWMPRPCASRMSNSRAKPVRSGGNLLAERDRPDAIDGGMGPARR